MVQVKQTAINYLAKEKIRLGMETANETFIIISGKKDYDLK